MVHNHIGCITNLDYALLVSVAHNIVAQDDSEGI